jgi:hypothetical protein
VHDTSKPSPSAEAAAPIDAGRAVPAFVEIADGTCRDRPRVIDAGDATFLISRTQARRADPGRADLEEVAGLPSPRGSAGLFALRPFIIDVDRPDPTNSKPDTVDLLGYFVLDPRTHAFSRMEKESFRPDQVSSDQGAVFGDDPTAFPVPAGTLVITFTHGTNRPNDPSYGVPAGDGSQAVMVSADGQVSPFPRWPNVLYTDLFSADGVIWAMIIRPGMPGKFVLRVPLDGAPRYFPVPGTAGCRGDERLFPLARLVEQGAAADEVTVDVDDYRPCEAKAATGRYRLSAPDARWRKQPASSAGEPVPTQSDASAGPVQIGGATLRIEGTRALITGPGAEGERDADPDPPGSPADKRSIEVTAGGREVWLHATWQARCRLVRYRSW